MMLKENLGRERGWCAGKGVEFACTSVGFEGQMGQRRRCPEAGWKGSLERLVLG